MRKPNYDEAIKIVDKVYNTTDFTKEQLQPLNEYLDYALGLEAELYDYKHNYKALKEFYDNSVAYATKIQNELNELKHDVARFMELYNDRPHLLIEEWDEYKKLEQKLSKVGKEE